MGRGVTALLVLISLTATSHASTGANDSDSGVSFADYRRCYVLDVWRLSQVAAESPEARAITAEGRALGASAMQTGVDRGRSSESVIADLRTYSATRTALYQSESANPDGPDHATDDEAYCRRRGLVRAVTHTTASSPAP